MATATSQPLGPLILSQECIPTKLLHHLPLPGPSPGLISPFMALSPSSQTVTKPPDLQVFAFFSELLKLSHSSAPSVLVQCPSVPSSTGNTELHSLCASTWDSKLLKASVCVSCTLEAITSVD